MNFDWLEMTIQFQRGSRDMAVEVTFPVRIFIGLKLSRHFTIITHLPVDIIFGNRH